MDTAEAQRIIGNQERNDYLLQPSAHADLYRSTAPALAELLRRAAIGVVADSYEHHDRDAIAAQATYLATVTWANTAVFATAAFGAGTMAVEILGREFPGFGLVGWLAAALAALTAVAGAAAGMLLYQVREGQLLETWMSARAHAESARLDYFALLAAEAAPSKSAPLLGLVLEYFRRYQLEVQRTYYKRRRQEHMHSARHTTRIGSLGAALAALTAGGVASGPWAALGALGVVGAAVTAFSVAREQVRQDRRNAERYGRTVEALLTLQGRLDEVRDAVAAGNAPALSEFVAAVNEQISLEHRQWLEASESAKAGLARLNDALAVSHPWPTASPAALEKSGGSVADEEPS